MRNGKCQYKLFAQTLSIEPGGGVLQCLVILFLFSIDFNRLRLFTKKNKLKTIIKN